MSRIQVVGVCLAALALGVGGCGGSDGVGAGDDGGEGGEDGAGASGSGASDGTGATSGAQGGDPSGTGASGSSGATTGGSGGSGTSSSSGPSSTSSSGSGGSPSCDFSPENSCDAAQILPAISGDEGFDLRVEHGNAGRWYHVFVEENSVGISGLEYTVTLENAPGMNFDLVVRTGNDNMPDCGAPEQLGVDEPEAVTISMSDTIASNQGHWISIFVHHTSGTECDPDDAWTLTIQGNFAYSCQDDGSCTSADDCICGDCTQDAYCADPQNCNDDGVCDPYGEGCGCTDCASVPQCS